MNIRQIQVQYNPDHDRLLGRIGTDDGAEIRFWLTRRLTERLWPGLLKATEAVAMRVLGERGAGAVGEARGMMTGMARDAALAQADFSQPFNTEPASLPLGPEPLLVSRIDLAPTDQGQLRMALRQDEQRGMEINLNEPTLHAFCRLIQREVDRADWGFKLAFGPDAAGEARPAKLN